MKTDLYTKTILTVIAVALTALAIENTEIFPQANAAGSTPPGFATVPVNADGSISVRFSETMKVDLTEVSGNYINGVLPVNLKEISGSSINSSYGIPVNIEAVDGSSVYGAIPTKEKN